MNVAVLGANGQLGTDLVRALGTTAGYAVSPFTHDQIEIADAESVHAGLSPVRPDVVVHCAAFHRVDECEERPAEALRVNALGALNVARVCASLNAVCVYISTDFVFGGQHQGPYAEVAPPSPVNVYGVSKLAGEFFVCQACPQWLIVRTASLFGTTRSRAKRGNFVEAILDRARAGQPLEVVEDVRMSPTYTRDAARALALLVRHDARGLVHLTNAGSCTWHEFAARIVTCAGLSATVIPIPASRYPTKARRPNDSSLRSVRIPDPVRRCLRPWPEALRAYLDEREASAGAEETR
jgi:dTDP-4-dehydrorhamnose reductase